MRYTLVLLLAAAHCAAPNGRRDSSQVERRPSAVDILVSVSWGNDSLSFVHAAAASFSPLLRTILEPPDSRPVRDFHFGVVSSKIDMPNVCVGNEQVRNDGTLLIPDVRYWANGPEVLGWPPASWSSWPPAWPFLSSQISRDRNLPSLATIYVRDTMGRAQEGECSVTQFLESAVRASDGRNAGFLRPDSLLVLIILADREDCSTSNPALWRLDNWGTTYARAGDWCLEPPEGLLVSVEHYVAAFKESRSGTGRVLVFVTARSAPIRWASNGLKYASPVCGNQHVIPANRLLRFVEQINQMGDPNLEARLADPCSYVGSDGTAAERHMEDLGHRILQIVTR